MKRLPIVLGSILLLVMLVTGCGRAPHYDSRLVAADSLLRSDPDSALSIIQAVTPDSLATLGDRAYRDLLLTQTRYKCYITATSDSDINRALAYYQQHSREREKLTRAYIYKGAVMEELGHPDSAMLYYKQAEATADKKDYVNLRQINTRIADLFRIYNADKQTCYDKYAQALKYYRLTGNKPLQLNCLYNMGMCSGITRTDDPEELLNQACQLAAELNDSANYYMCQEIRCRQLYYRQESLQKAKQIALVCLNDYSRFVNNDLLLDLADIYIRSGMPDSAKYYLSFINPQIATSDLSQIRTRKHLIISRIAGFEGDTALSNHHNMLAHQISDSISNNKSKYLIQQIESDFNRNQFSDALSSLSLLQWTLVIIICLVILLTALFIISHFRRIHNFKAIIAEMTSSQSNVHAELLNQLDAKNGIIEQQLISLVGLMKECASNSEMQDSTSTIAQEIKNTIKETVNDDFWSELKKYLDKKHHGIISNLAYTPGISPKDLRFISLCCCGFSNSEIALIMDYSLKYISNKRKHITQKLGIDIPLQNYLNILMTKTGETQDYQKQ